MAVVVPALAQPPPTSSYPAPCDESRVSRTDRDRAHTVFLSGKQFLEESNYDKSISYFKDAYTIDCSVHGILPIIAAAYERKGDKREAVRALEEYLRRAPNAPDHDVIERRIRNLNDQIALEAPATPSASSSALSTSPTTAPSVAPAPTESATAAAPSASPSPPASKDGGGSGAVPWIVTGVGAAVAAGGAVLLAVGASDISNAESACPSRKGCSSQAVDQGNTGRTLEPIGYTGIGVGAAAIIAGLVWHFTEKPATGSVTGAIHVGPVGAPNFAGMSVSGQF